MTVDSVGKPKIRSRFADGTREIAKHTTLSKQSRRGVVSRQESLYDGLRIFTTPSCPADPYWSRVEDVQKRFGASPKISTRFVESNAGVRRFAVAESNKAPTKDARCMRCSLPPSAT